jgi:hypothetical protein
MESCCSSGEHYHLSESNERHVDLEQVARFWHGSQAEAEKIAEIFDVEVMN